MNYLQAACDHLNIEETAVLSHHIGADSVSLVVDRGIAGCPKYTLLFSELSKPVPVVAGGGLSAPKAGPVHVDYERFTKAKLVEMGEKRGLDLSMSMLKTELIEALEGA